MSEQRNDQAAAQDLGKCLLCGGDNDYPLAAVCTSCQKKSAATERDLLATTDAQVWARAFIERFAGRMVSAGDVDEGLMISWFANAIETGRTVGETK